MPGESANARLVKSAAAPRVLCAGIIVLDEVFRVDEFPRNDGKVEAKAFFAVNGGCAANAAVAVARLGGRAALAGPLGGPAGSDENGDRVLAALSREAIDISACQRVDGLKTALSAIFINARGERTIVTYRDPRIAAVTPRDPEAVVGVADIVLADNRFPQFVRPICEAARRRGLRVVLDADKTTAPDDPLFGVATHVIFSAECLSATTGRLDLADALRAIARHTGAFLAVSNGPNDILFIEAGAVRQMPVFQVCAVDTLGAGDALHGGFTLALAEGAEEAAALLAG
jgi:sulfofructose kinase